MENLGLNSTNGDFSFLVQGTYHILSVTKEMNRSGYYIYPARVRHLLNGHWINETVNLAFLFSNGAKGSLYGFQRDTLVGQTIKITNRIPQISALGKTYYTYNWEITEAVNSEFFNDQDITYSIGKINNLIASKRQQAVLDSQEDSELFEGIDLDSMNELNNLIASKRQKNK